MERSTCLSPLSPVLRRYAPRVMALCDRMATNPGLKALFARVDPDVCVGGSN